MVPLFVHRIDCARVGGIDGSNGRQRTTGCRGVEHIFFRGELDTKSNENLDGGSDASDRQRHFLRAPRFPFFPRSGGGGGVRQRRHAAAIHDGSVCTDQIQFPAAY